MIEIREATATDIERWGAMRATLFEMVDDGFLEQEMLRFLDDDHQAAYIAFDGDRAIGFVELSLRNFVDGCLTSPVGYIEGLYVEREARGRGAGRGLVERGLEWCRRRGCTEFATDSLLEDTDAQSFHKRMGFAETYRIVQFKLAEQEHQKEP